jgi:hypothetical protein
MDDVLTIAEIRGRYDSEWILVADPELDENLNVLRGRVVCHSKDRDEVDHIATRLRLKRSAFLYTGEIPEGTAVVL